MKQIRQSIIGTMCSCHHHSFHYCQSRICPAWIKAGCQQQQILLTFKGNVAQALPLTWRSIGMSWRIKAVWRGNDCMANFRSTACPAAYSSMPIYYLFASTFPLQRVWLACRCTFGDYQKEIFIGGQIWDEIAPFSICDKNKILKVIIYY